MGTGSVIPLRCFGPSGTNWTARKVRVRPRTVSLTSSSPGPASAQSLAARLTAEPTKPSGVSAVSPAWTPTPTLMPTVPPSLAPAAAAASRMANPPRTAALADGEDHVEAVTLCPDLGAVGPRDDLADQDPVTCQQLCCRLVPVQFDEACVVTQVGEKEAAGLTFEWLAHLAGSYFDGGERGSRIDVGELSAPTLRPSPRRAGPGLLSGRGSMHVLVETPPDLSWFNSADAVASYRRTRRLRHHRGDPFRTRANSWPFGLCRDGTQSSGDHIRRHQSRCITAGS